MNNRKVNTLIKDMKDLDVFEFENENYIKVDDFVKVWQKFLSGGKNICMK